MMFNPSELGTKAYWEKFYETEINNFNTIGDVGEIWFGESKEKQALKFCKETINKANSTIMDIGCGNGHLSVVLAQSLKSHLPHIYAVDYSPNAIELSKSLFKSEEIEENIILEELDITVDIDQKWSDLIFIAIDKGTYDAISLCPDNAIEKRDKYRENVFHIVQKNGFLLIISCNWTEEELKSHFIDGTNKWVYYKTLPSISFSFGGKEGNNVTSVVFQKN